MLHTSREIYRILHHYARNEIVRNPDTSAYMAADFAVRCYFDNFDYDSGIDTVLDVSKAVLWAVHWKYKESHENLRSNSGQSERRLNFDGARPDLGVWFSGPAHLLPS